MVGALLGLELGRNVAVGLRVGATLGVSVGNTLFIKTPSSFTETASSNESPKYLTLRSVGILVVSNTIFSYIAFCNASRRDAMTYWTSSFSWAIIVILPFTTLQYLYLDSNGHVAAVAKDNESEKLLLTWFRKKKKYPKEQPKEQIFHTIFVQKLTVSGYIPSSGGHRDNAKTARQSDFLFSL